MKHGYESLTWVRGKDGKQSVCSIDQSAGKKNLDQLTEEVKKACT